jgi:hypothetical protein
MKCAECDREAHAKGLCITHYMRARRAERKDVTAYDRAYSRRRSTALQILATRHPEEWHAIMESLKPMQRREESAQRWERITELNQQILRERAS